MRLPPFINSKIWTIFLFSIFSFLVAWVSIIHWIDKQTVPTIHDSRFFVLGVALVYPYFPVFDKEKNIIRTIKISHLVVAAKQNEKGLVNFAKDLRRSYSMLTNLINTKRLLPNDDGEALLSLSFERLIFFNRMTAMAVAGGRKINGTEEVISNLRDMKNEFEEDIAQAIEREMALHQMLLNKVPFDLTKTSNPLIDAANKLYEGLGLCIIGNQEGAELIRSANDFYSTSRFDLIHLLVRNPDWILVALAGTSNGTECSNSVKEIIQLLQRR